MAVVAQEFFQDIGSAEQKAQPAKAAAPVPDFEFDISVSGASKEIAMTRSFCFRSHGAEIVHGPVFERGRWRIYLRAAKTREM